MEEQLRIEGAPEDLEEIRRQLFAELGDDLELDEMSSQGAGELREPVLIGLVVALGGPQVVKGVVKVLDRYMLHRERMRALDLAFLREKPEPVTLADVQSLAR
jgi:hypothetical protein